MNRKLPLPPRARPKRSSSPLTLSSSPKGSLNEPAPSIPQSTYESSMSFEVDSEYKNEAQSQFQESKRSTSLTPYSSTLPSSPIHHHNSVQRRSSSPPLLPPTLAQSSSMVHFSYTQQTVIYDGQDTHIQAEQQHYENGAWQKTQAQAQMRGNQLAAVVPQFNPRSPFNAFFESPSLIDDSHIQRRPSKKSR